MTSALFTGHLEYNRWATEEILKLVEPLPQLVRDEERSSSHGGILGTLVHHYRSDAAWFDRMQGLESGGPAKYPIPDDFGAFAAQWRTLLDEYVAWGHQLQDDAAWMQELDYQNFAGDRFRSPVWQMMFTVVNHGRYHRGQVVTMIRQAGYKAAATDLIHFYRAVKKQQA